MTRVLLVYHDTNVADVEEDYLRRAGYEVDRCAGPVGGEPCPVLHGSPCWQVEKADVLIYDTWDTQLGHAEMVEDLLEMHPDKPLVLTSALRPGELRGDRRRTGQPLVAPSRADLPDTIERALKQPRPSAAARTLAPFTRQAYGRARW